MTVIIPDRTLPTTNRPRKWWPEGTKDPHLRIHQIVSALEGDGRREKHAAFERIYGDSTLSEDTTRMFAATLGLDGGVLWQRTPVIRSMVDTMMNRLGRIRPRPRPMPRGGDPHIAERARLLDLWLDAWLERLSDHDELFRQMLLDGLVTGLGVVKHCIQDGAPRLELVHPSTVHVEPQEQRHNCLLTFYQVLAVDREVLWQTYQDAELREAIESAAEFDNDLSEGGSMRDGASDLVKVVEAWRLPTQRDENGEWIPGSHLITVSSATLNMDEREWKRPRLPFSFYRYRRLNRRFDGLGLVESSACMQADLNEIDDVLAEAYRLMTPGMLVQEGSLPPKRMTNSVGRVIMYDGVPPQPWVPPAVSPDFISRGDSLENRMLRMEGISPFSSQSMKPAGLNSGIAIEAHENLEAERHALPSQAYEAAIMDVGEGLLDIADEIAECDETGHHAKLKILGGKRTLEEVSYGSARMKRDGTEVRMSMWPVSRLSRGLTGRLEQGAHLRELGVIPNPDDMLDVLDLPDLDAYTRNRLAPRKLAESMVDRVLLGKPAHVHPYMDLEHLLKFAANARSQAELDGVDEDALVRLDDLIGAASDELQKLAPPPAPAPAGAPPMDVGAPAMPPGPMMMPPEQALPMPGMPGPGLQ